MLLWKMSFHVKSQVVGSGETAFADLALERLGSGVLAVVARQLIGPGEPPLTLRPMTFVGLFTCWDDHRYCQLAFDLIYICL